MPYNGFDITNKIILVTGGTSGIGRAIALGCAEAGAKVIAGSTNPDKVGAMKQELGAGNDAVQLNVAEEQSVKAAFEQVRSKYGKIDAIVNAAGVIKRQPSLEMPVEEFKRIVDINLVGNFVVCQQAGR